MANQDDTCSDLNVLYEQALNLMESAQSKPRGYDRQTSYLKSRKLFDKCLELIEKLSLFSNNETIEDVGTSEIKYILTSAYLSKIMISIECESDRLNIFTQARDYALKFLNLVNQYGINSHRLDKILRCDINEEIEQKISLQDAMRSRDEKIAIFKARKILDDNIEELERRIKNGIDVDDEVRREYYINLINRFIEDTIDSLENEIKMALIFERTKSDIIPSDSSSTSPKPFKPITIVKDQLQKQVFGIGYPSKPTVTVDEFINQKFKDGDLVFQKDKQIYSNSLQRYAEEPDLRRNQEELSDEEKEAKREKDDEDEIKRLRNWDKFRDENPRGSGNRKNMG